MMHHLPGYIRRSTLLPSPSTDCNLFAKYGGGCGNHYGIKRSRVCFSHAGDRLLAIKLHARKEEIRLNLNGCAGDLSSRTQQKAF